MGDTSLPPINKQKPNRDEEGMSNSGEKWTPKNWNNFKKTERDLKKMAPQLKSRYMAYEDPPKHVSEAQSNTKKRLIEKKKQIYRDAYPDSDEDSGEKDKQEKLIGQLKAAEARNRIRIMRLRYQANRAQEINHLISCQPTARQAVRLQALVPVHPDDRSQGDKLDKLSRARVEALLEDSQGLLTLRT